MHVNYYHFGLFVGLFVGCLVAGLLLRFVKTEGSWRCRFDERQELHRGRGYKYGFYTLLCYIVVDYVVINVFEKQWAAEGVDILIGVIVSVGVYAIYCIFHEAFLSLNENPKRYVAVIIFCMLLNGLGAVMQFQHNPVIENGQLTTHCMNLVCAVLMAVVLIALALKYGISQKED